MPEIVKEWIIPCPVCNKVITIQHYGENSETATIARAMLMHFDEFPKEHNITDLKVSLAAMTAFAVLKRNVFITPVN